VQRLLVIALYLEQLEAVVEHTGREQRLVFLVGRLCRGERLAVCHSLGRIAERLRSLSRAPHQIAELAQVDDEFAPHVGVVRLDRDDQAAQLQSTSVAVCRAGRVALVRLERAALHVAQSFVGRGDLALQCRVSRGFLRQAVEVDESGLQDEMPRRARAGQIQNRVVDIEDQ
jgi:hypothetical protein